MHECSVFVLGDVDPRSLEHFLIVGSFLHRRQRLENSLCRLSIGRPRMKKAAHSSQQQGREYPLAKSSSLGLLGTWVVPR